MSENEKLSERNAAIQRMLSNGETLMNFYRFAAQNPHLSLREACQIILERPNASVCFSFEEWNAMGRRVNKGSKGIPYVDLPGMRRFAFDATDTHGDGRYRRPIYPMKRLLHGLDVLNGTDLSEDRRGDFRKIKSGVRSYLKENDYLSQDEEHNNLLTEGVSYFLYCKTGFPKSNGITLSGLPYDLQDNASFFMNVKEVAEYLQSEIERAYVEDLNKVEVIDDIEEETVSDEPVIPTRTAEETEASKEVKPLHPIYARYMETKSKFPNAAALFRIGDFYEIFGEEAKTIGKELDLTITGRDVGLDERLPMIGFPYHVAGQYIERILENHSVVVIEPEEEPKYILSHAEALGEKPSPESIYDDDYEDDPDRESGYFEAEDTDDEVVAEDEESEQEQPVLQTQRKEKSIRERKRKEKPQLSFFDNLDEYGNELPQDPREKLIKEILQKGSLFENGKFRIVDYYKQDPSIHDFAAFLKNEYGIGGMYNSPISFNHDGKGIAGKYDDKDHPETYTDFVLNWNEVATRIADLIDDGEYLSAEEQVKYQQYLAEKQGTPDEPPDVPTEPQITENTDLNGIGFNQSELGGAKARFQANLEAIRLVNQLEKEGRLPTKSEQLILAKYVGWGGLAKAFDEHDANWQKEYRELKDALNPEDYEKARGSVLNAHFTSKEVIEGIYKALSQMGVKGNNRILEPAMGTGNFFGFMPKEIADGARLFGVELDTITGKIAQKLYPNANIQIKGFEATSFSNNRFDLVVGNVPFGAYTVYDSEYAKQNFYIHDYFLAKSIDKLKPNGLMAVITSTGTMDKLNPSVRKYLAERAELLGAIRLPNTAFQQNAGTQVVADILFFRKREEQGFVTPEDTEWLSTGKTEEGFEINNYFLKHPEMVLGTLTEEHGLYGALDVTVKSDGRTITEALNQAIEHLPKDLYENPEYTEEQGEEIAVDYNVKPLCYKAENGKLFLRVGDEMIEQEIPKTPKDAYERISEMITLRNELRYVLEIQTEGCSDEKLAEEQKKLNANYDSFVRRYGYLNSQTNSRLFRDDADSALLFACEDVSEDKEKVTKADVFSKRTIRPYVAVTSTDDCFEALQISKNERGQVDISYIEELTGKDYDTVLKELDTAVFRNPYAVNPHDQYSGFVTAEEYLSGNVVQKLEAAKVFAAESPELYERNVKALEQVQPEPIPASDIGVRIGASWIDTDYYKQFLYHLLDIPTYYYDGLEIYYNRFDSSWRVDRQGYLRWSSWENANEVYGTSRANAYRLFEDCLNLRATTIYDTVENSDGSQRRVLNQAETIAAREKQNKIKEAFVDWIFHDPTRREALEKKYNSIFNQTRLPTYDGSYLRFPGMNPAIELRPHQKDAVHRIVSTGNNTLLHHVVGSGKTFTMFAAGMKLRQYGLAKKIMYAVPNNLVEQWASQGRQLYPDAKILVATKDDLSKEKRQRFVSKVAMGDWDAIIIAQSSFAKIPISKERQIRKIQEEISRIEETIEATWTDKGMPRGAVKNLEKVKKNREAQLKKLLDDDKKDGVLIFENLGVDYLFVDEAHFYKNKFLFTKMNNVAGISTTASQRASDLELKCEYINELHGGDKGVVFATGTPISNSMTEMYTMQSYLQKEALQHIGITFFDNWAANFGETVTSLEMAPSGQGYKARTRFSKFTNLPELLTMYRSFADVQTQEMVKLDVPDVDRKVITLKPSDTVLELADKIADRAEEISHGNVPPEVDNMLKVTSDGKKLALDPRCFDRTAGDEEGSKINECAERIFEIWQDTTATRGTQLVFCDLSTPKKAFEDYEYGKDFDVYNDLKYKLVEMGIPKEEIAFIHDANSDKAKQSLYDKINSGAVRVLIGSTEKCGAGMNVQERLVALHHLDTPYRPSDMQQREGRIIRQGNTNKEVKIFTYVTERTFDSYSYQILENKQRFISQIDRGDLTMREAEDIDETTLSYAEIKAITAANPKIKRKMEVDTEIARLRVLEGQYKKNLFALQDKIRKTYPEEIQRQTLYLERLRTDIATVKDKFNPDVFSINVQGKTYTDKKEGGQALMDALMHNPVDTVVAEYGGLKISLEPLMLLTIERSISLSGAGKYSMEIGQSASGLLTRLDNFLSAFPDREARASNKLIQLQSDLKVAEEQVQKPFEHREKLAELVKEQAELNAELDLNRREEVVIDEEKEDTVVSVPDEEHDRSVPERTVFREKTKPRKHITEQISKTYNKVKEEEPDAYVFIKNGSNYEIYGEQAEELADKHGLPTITDQETVVLSVNYGELDELIRDVIDRGSKAKIIEETIEEKEESFIDTEEPIVATQDEVDYREEVGDRVEKEFDAYRDHLLGEPALNVFYKSYETHVKTELYEVLTDGDSYLTEDEYKALAKEDGNLLSLLYDDYLSDEYASVNNYGDTAEFIHNYIERHLKDNAVFLGKDSENTAYYKMSEGHLSRARLPEFKEQADQYVIAAPALAMSQEELERYHIFFLKTGRDIPEALLDDRENAVENMRIAVSTVQRERAYETNKEEQSTPTQEEEMPQAENTEKKTNWIEMSVPSEAMFGSYEKRSLFVMPNQSEVKGAFYVPNSFVSEDKTSDEERFRIAVPEDFEFTVKNRETDLSVKLSAEKLRETIHNTKPEDYEKQKQDTPKEKPNETGNGWQYLSVDKTAVIAEYDGRTLLRMPNGQYAGYCYYLPNGLLRENAEKGTYRVSLPEGFTVTLNNRNAATEAEKKIELTADDYIKEVRGKTADDYEQYQKPSESKNDTFSVMEQQLRDRVPEEMLNKPNWVVVRVKENAANGRLDKYLIDIHTGKFAESDNPDTWATFDDAAKYAKENGGVTLAYALDGKDGICCIDLDHCFDEHGKPSLLAEQIKAATQGSYREISLSGQGLHLFGKTEGLDVKAFSKDGDSEFYQKSHFIAVTGNTLDGKELLNFDELPVKAYLLEHHDKRTALSGAGKGVEGLSKMSDHDVVEKACKAKHGDVFKALYEGQDLQGNHSNSDMSLMNRLAYWCNGDKEQMLRIFATSGLFREGKSPDYYEGTAIKAIRDTGTRFQPKSQVPVNHKPVWNSKEGK